ncbi:MAG: formate dehydrogenase subunit alpha [Lentisphaeria bacterium]|jgi:formate dehydrogenase major subunit|nr:formate dehydrogenase subunit alpha [Lentisphaeria bacterium]MDP7742048.1 formate dehydrogenase subunit alpha [Lentisphaeria bacterium]
MNKTAYLDGEACEIEAGENLLNFIERQRGKGCVPTLCHDERLEPFGSCRLCSVEVANSEDGPRRMVAACHTPVAENMWVFSQSDSVRKLRRNIVELVVSDYPADTLGSPPDNDAELKKVIDQVGFDIHSVRYPAGKNHADRRQDTSHPYMRADLSKCINCYRCVRACDEVQGQFVLSMAGRGFDNHIIMGADKPFKESPCVSCGACSQTCPTGAITDIHKLQAHDAERQVRTVCTYCGVGCNLEVAVGPGDNILSIEAPPAAEANRGHTCLKGRYAFKFQSHPDRLRSPLIRRGEGFEEVSWDEAYDYIAEKLSGIRSEHGPDAIAGISSARCTNEENYLMQKFIRAVIGTNNIDCCARVCHSPTALGMQWAFGTGAGTNSIECLKNTDLVMIIGANPTHAHPVTGARIKQEVMKGTPLIVIDPIVTELAAYAKYHLALRPGTNVAVLNMFAYYLVDEGLVDREFIDGRCEGYEAYVEQLRQVDIDKMEAVCGVDRELVREAAIAYGTAGNAMIFHGLGVTEHSQGTRTVTMIADLAMMTGNLGRTGVGVNPLRGQNNVQGAADMGVQPHQGAGYLPVTDPDNRAKYEKIYGVPVPEGIGYTIPQMFDAAHDGKLKALWIMGEDVAQTDPNTKHVMAALQNLELLVVQEIFMTETAKLAQVVLPGATFLEKSGTFTSGERRVQRCNQVVPPLEGTKPDGQIVVDIMNRMGYGQAGYDPDVTLQEISRIVPFFAGAKWEEFGDNGKQWPIQPDGSDTKILHTETFKRGRGKFHFWEFEESQELVDNSDGFPFILTTGRKLEHYNSGTMTRRTGNLQLLSEDLLVINPVDAGKKNIADGDTVRLFSARGEVNLTAELSTCVSPGVVYTTFHFPEQMVNYVTSNVQDKESLCPEYKVVAVDVERVTAAAAPGPAGPTKA